ncbi:MAG: YqhA family protein [Actinomycetota bacterium]
MKRAIRKVIQGSRYLVSLAVVGAFLAAALTLVYGLIMVGVAIRDTVTAERFTVASTKLLSVHIIDIIDLLLLGTVLYIVAVGLYVLFLDEDIELHGWLAFRDMEDLKTRLVGVIIVLLGVEFLGAVVEWNGRSDILQLGVAVGVAVLALAGFIIATALLDRRGHKAEQDKQPPSPLP